MIKILTIIMFNIPYYYDIKYNMIVEIHVRNVISKFVNSIHEKDIKL